MQKQLSIPTQEPQVKIINNQLMVSSLDIATKFNKQHAHILRTIKGLDIPKDFSASNFGLAEYLDEQGKPRPYYNMTRDGFVILVMGFTGKEAMQWKIRYIQAFNAMETQLLQKPQQLQLDAPSTVKDRKPITDLLNTWVKFAPIDYRSARIMLNAHLSVEHAEQITLAQIPVAVAFLQEQINLHTAKPAYADYPDAQLGLITELALQGARRFSLYISLGDKKTRNTSLITKGFKADVYLFEENAIEPKSLNYSVKFVK